MDLQQFLYLAATVVFAFACRTFSHRWVRKAGLLALLAATYMLGWFLTGSHAAGACGIALWFMLPWLEIMLHVRKLRFPALGGVKGRFAPNAEIFPELAELTEEIESHGFERADDAGWKWSDTDHFQRLFYHPELRSQAAIGFAQQVGIPWALSYVSITSRTQDGQTYTTHNLAYPQVMKPAPGQWVNRFLSATSLEDLLEEHAAFLNRHGVRHEDLAELRAESLPETLESELRSQIDHNVHVGLIETVGDGLLRYSWRGCFFLWFQAVKEFLFV
jgi:hypothetical protein